MQRRDFMKAIMAASVAANAAPVIALGQPAPQSGQQPANPTAPPNAPPAPAPVPWMRGLSEARPLPMTPLTPDAFAETIVQFFSPTQFATLRHLGEVMLPATKDYPGAVEAGAIEFLDFLIGVSPEDRQALYQSGLDRLESESKHHFGLSFSAVSAEQADQLLRPWMRTWMTDHPPTEPYEHFINIAHSDLRTATYNSQAWSDAAHKDGKQTPFTDLYWYPVDPDIHRDSAAVHLQNSSKKQRAN